MNRADVMVFESAVDFRRWLEKHHATVQELWVGYYKKGAAKTSMTYPESVEEALCFGWIDGLTRRIDDEVYATRFTPRRPTSNWSAANIAKVAELEAAGRMHPSGLRVFEERDRRRDDADARRRVPHELPEDLLERLRADAAAWSFWEARPPAFRRVATSWILSAKRPETQEKRFTTLLHESARGRLPAPFLVTRAQRGKTTT